MASQSVDTGRPLSPGRAVSRRPWISLGLLESGGVADGVLAYGLALLIGFTAVLGTITPEAALGHGPGWALPTPDAAQALTGHIAYQWDAWRWPLLDARTLFWPRGVSIALTDSNPLVSMIAKLWVTATGDAPVDLLAPFWTLCWLMQPVAAAYAARSLGLGLLPTVAAAVLAALWPAQLRRVDHLNLCAQFLIMLALGLAFRHRERGGELDHRRDRGIGIVGPTLLMLVAVMTQPYIYALTAAALAIVPLQSALTRRPGWVREALRFAIAAGVPLVVLTVLSGPLGGGDKGFVFFSMNVLSPIWPQHSGVFGADLPVIDATGGQYEGFNWVGAGGLLLLIAGVVQWIRLRPAIRPHLGMIVVLAGLTLMSLSSRIYVGHWLVLNLGVKPWEDIFAAFRSVGRAFWPVGYAIMLLSVAAVARLRPVLAVPLLLAAIALQVVDTGPLRADVRQVRDFGSGVGYVPVVPATARLVSVAPYPGCNAPVQIRLPAETMLLHAARQGARIGPIGLGRPPRWFSCELMQSDEFELPLLQGELRGFFSDAMAAKVRPSLLGPEAVCAADQGVVLCGRGIGPLPGRPIPASDDLPRVPLGVALAGGALDPMLGFGWKAAGDEIWSEGPLDTLLMALPREGDVVVDLKLSGISFASGGVRTIEIRAGRVLVATLDLPDGAVTDATIKVPAAAAPDGVLRLAFSTVRPVDPVRRGLSAPVSRAAVRLISMTVRMP